MNPHALVVVEASAAAAEGFYPFSCLHCLWELRWGPLRLLEWWQHRFPEARVAVAVPPEREPWYRSFLARFPGITTAQLHPPLLLLNAQLLPSQATLEVLRKLWGELGQENPAWALFCNEVPMAVWIGLPELPPQLAGLRWGRWDSLCSTFCAELPRKELPVPMVHFLWDLVAALPAAFAEAEAAFPVGIESEPWHRRGVWILAPERVWIASTAELSPGVVIDARKGAVLIGEEVVVQPHVALMGPCAIGARSLLRAHATVGAYTTIGEHCRIGGEVAHSIFHAYANKQHEGFVGHSYIGEWVNLGAGTTTSNLKNTYGTVRLRLPMGVVDTGLQFLGTLCGDHTKTAIGTFLRTGAVLGISVNVLSGGMQAQWVPSFAWGDAAQPQPYAWDKALEVAQRMMARRGKTLLSEEQELFRHEYAHTWLRARS